MKKERIMILKMVSEGKITVDEAVKLMDSMKVNKSIDAGEVIDSVKEKVCDFVEDAKPVVKKCADKAMEVGEEVYSKGKAKVQEYKSKAKNKDFVDDVIIEPVDEVFETASQVKETVDEAVEEVIEPEEKNE